MNFLGDIYKISLSENEKNIKFWEGYLHDLTSLDFSVYLDKLKVPILVPIGNKIFFRGTIKHTNEVTVAIGADYFTKCSVKQAEVLREHRIKDAKSKLEVLNKEKDYIGNQISLSNEIIHGRQGQDIIEVHSEEEDRAWRERHKERVRQYYQNKQKKNESKDEANDEQLWLRLEELELQEELENELADGNDAEELDDKEVKFDSFVIKENNVKLQTEEDEDTSEGPEVGKITHYIPKQTSKLNLLRQVIDRQKMLEDKLSELKNRERVQSKTEGDLLSRLDEIEQLDELEDEMNRIDDILEDDEHDSVINEDDEHDSVINEDTSIKTSKSVSFAENDDETIEISFMHSDIEPSKKPYNPKEGITKPSDLYEAYSNFFSNEKISILKKSKYEDFRVESFPDENTIEMPKSSDVDDIETIIVKDVIEKTDYSEHKLQNDTRPISLFKKKRQQQKS